jgi:two-component system response regulator DesR
MIRIVIAEDQEMLLGAIGSLLNLEDDMEVVGKANNGEEALSLVRQLQPDVCIMDIDMPKKSGLEAAEALKTFHGKIIILTTFARTGYLQRAINADVCGYLLKDSPSEELAASIRSIMEGERIYAPELIEDEASGNEPKMEEFERLAEGETINQQAKTIGTVKNYFTSIMDKIKLPTG